MNYKIVAITDTQYYEENFSLKKLAAKVACAKALDDQTLHELLADPLLASTAQIEPLAQIIDRLKLAKNDRNTYWSAVIMMQMGSVRRRSWSMHCAAMASPAAIIFPIVFEKGMAYRAIPWSWLMKRAISC